MGSLLRIKNGHGIEEGVFLIMKYIKNDTRLSLKEQKEIVDLALLGGVLFAKPTLQQLISAMMAMIAEKMLDGAFPSINWIAKDEINKYNSLDGVNELEKIVRSKISSIVEEAETSNMRSVWMDIVDEVKYEITYNMKGNYLSSPSEKEYDGEVVKKEIPKVQDTVRISSATNTVDNPSTNNEIKVNKPSESNNVPVKKKFKWSEHFFLMLLIDIIVVASLVFPTMAVSEGLAVGLGFGGQAIVFIVFGIAIKREKK